MTNEKVTSLLNQQINAELFSAYLYWDFAIHFDSAGLKGFADWYKIQAQEEINHAKKICDYMQSQGCNIKLTPIADPSEEVRDGLSLAKLGLKHEKQITKMIDDIYAAANKDNDNRTMNFLTWFIEEQAEEEENARDIVSLFKQTGDNSAALYLADYKMGRRGKEN